MASFSQSSPVDGGPLLSMAQVRRNSADTPSSHVMRFGADQPLLDSGQSIAPLQIAYQTYGTLNSARSNAILVCHALTGDQYVASDIR